MGFCIGRAASAVFKNLEDVEKGLETGSRVAVDDLDTARIRGINVLGAIATGGCAPIKETD
jgi:hypothetical protein